MIDDKGHITIPEFYDDVLEVSADERAKMAKAPFNLKLTKIFGIKALHGGRRILSTIEPVFVPHPMYVVFGRLYREGAKTVLPSVAHAKNQLPFGSQSKTR